jgi:hypothetical protein
MRSSTSKGTHDPNRKKKKPNTMHTTPHTHTTTHAHTPCPHRRHLTPCTAPCSLPYPTHHAHLHHGTPYTGGGGAHLTPPSLSWWKNIVMKILVYFSHKIIVPLGNVSNQYFASTLSEKENIRNLVASGSTSFMHIRSHILVNVFKCKPESSVDEPPNWFYWTKFLNLGLIS